MIPSLPHSLPLSGSEETFGEIHHSQLQHKHTVPGHVLILCQCFSSLLVFCSVLRMDFRASCLVGWVTPCSYTSRWLLKDVCLFVCLFYCSRDRGLTDGSAVRRAYSSCGGPKFCAQYQFRQLTTTYNSSSRRSWCLWTPRTLVLSAYTTLMGMHTQYTYKCTHN